jgi:hypothetical protein
MLVGRADGAAPSAHRESELGHQTVGERALVQPGQLEPTLATAGLHPGPRRKLGSAPAVTPDDPYGLDPENLDRERRLRGHDNGP